MRIKQVLKILGPGMLVAATGVGAGDLATGAFTGSKLGTAVLWAVLVGAGLKFVLNEGLARYQLATGETLLEGSVRHLGRPVQFVFLLYLLLWSWFVGSALMSACGVTAHAILPMVLEHPILVHNQWTGQTTELLNGKILFGIVHSLTAVVLVRLGGFKLFEKVMSFCIGLMFVTVIATAIAIRPDLSAVLRGMVVPVIPDLRGEGLQWSIALMGGVGGTLTILCYGYWIREEGREGPEQVAACRIDLAAGYLMTALFGMAMVIIGSRVPVSGKGSKLIVDLSEKLLTELGTAGLIGQWAFLIGAWGAVFSSLLGVWQSVPYLFADFVGLSRERTGNVTPADEAPRVDTSSWAYCGYLYAIAIVPMAGLWLSFQQVQKFYAIIGAAFIPLLAVVLLILNGRRDLVGPRYVNSPLTIAVLLAALLFFAVSGTYEAMSGGGGG